MAKEAAEAAKENRQANKRNEPAESKNCTIYKTADFIGKRWTLLILLELYKRSPGPARYSELKKSLPRITPKILSMRLKELEKEGMLIKKVNANSFPIRCEYILTKSGYDFFAVIKSMKKWSLKWKIKNKACSSTNCSDCVI